MGNANAVERHLVDTSRLYIVRGGVLDIEADAIVNAANISLLGGGGVDGAIHRAAGGGLLEECRTLHGCKTGDAKITKAYNISWAKHIIHTVGPVYNGKAEDATLLASCYKTSLDLAWQNGCKTVSFPCISTGIYGYPLADASAIAVATVKEWLCEHPDAGMGIQFCCFKESEFRTYESLLG